MGKSGKLKGLMLHPDQGSHYTSELFMKLSIQSYIHGYYNQIRSYRHKDGLLTINEILIAWNRITI